MLWLLLWACAEPEPPPPPPPDPCDVAWTELSTLADAAAGSTGPDEATFRTACEALPLATRDCLSPRVHATEPGRCEAALDALTDAERAAVSTALDGRARKP